MARQPRYKIPEIKVEDIFKSTRPRASTDYDPLKQAEGYEKRLKGAGLDINEITDKRNPVEKLLNLPKDQWWGLDILEIINRPQQAVYGFAAAGSEIGNAEGKKIYTPKELQFESEILFEFKAAAEAPNATQKTKDAYEKFKSNFEVKVKESEQKFKDSGVILPDDYKYVPYLRYDEMTGDRKASLMAQLDGLWKGLSGQTDYIGGAQFLTTSKPVGAENVVREVLGFVLDVKADPIDIPFAKIKGVDDAFRSLNKGVDAAKALETAGDTKGAAKVALESLQEASKNSKSLKIKINDVNELENILKVNKTTASEFLTKSSNSMKQYKSGLELMVQGVGDLSKGIVKKSDSLIVASAKFADKIQKFDPQSADALLNMGEKISYLTRYTDLKTGVYNTIKDFMGLPKNIKLLIKKITGSKFLADAEMLKIQKALKDGSDDLFNKFMDDIADKIVREPDTYGKYKGVAREQARKLFEQDLQVVYEAVHRYKPKVTLRDFLRGRKQGVSLYVDEIFRDDLLNAVKKITGDVYDRDELAKILFKKTTLGNGKKAYILQDGVLADINKTVKQRIKESTSFSAIGPGVVDNANTIVDSTGRVRLNLNKTMGTAEALEEFLDAQIDASRFYNEQELAKALSLLGDSSIADSIRFIDDIIERFAGVLDPKFQTKFKKEFVEAGLMPHNVTEKWAKLKVGTEIGGKTAVLKGDASAFTTRGFNMSAYEAQLVAEDIIKNQLAKGTLSDEVADFVKKYGVPPMFEQEMQMSLTAFAEKGVKLGGASNMISELALKGTLVDPTFVRPLKAGEKAPYGFQSISRDTLINKLEDLGQYIDNPQAIKDAKKIMKTLPPGTLLVDNRIFDAIGLLGDRKALPGWFKIIDFSNNLFKSAKLFTFGFLKNNIIGNLTNMMLSGISPKAFTENSLEAYKILKEGPELMYRSVNKVGVLNADELRRLQVFQEFIQEGFVDVSKDLLDLPPAIAKAISANPPTNPNALKKALSFFATANNTQDMQFRLIAYLAAKENPNLYLRLGMSTAGDFVRYSLFDPNDLTKFEKEYVKRLVPFYTFTKKNLVYQMKALRDNPTMFKNIQKWESRKWDMFGLEDEDVEEYKREAGWIPIWRFKDGKYVAIKANMPTSELFEFLKNPLQKGLGSIAPLIRAPFEMATNNQIFTGMPIEQFEGQESRLRKELKTVMPNLPSWVEFPGGRGGEYLLSQTGLDVPFGGAVRTAKTAWQVINSPQDAFGEDTQTTVDTLASGPLRSLISLGDPAQSRLNLNYGYRDLLADKIKYYKQQGVDVPTITELENRRKFRYLKDLEIRMSKFKPRNR
jgi:hypothetical protein